MQDYDDLSLDAREIGAAPIVRHFFNRLGLDGLLETYVPERRLGRRPQITHAQAIAVMLMNVLISRSPLYAIPEWLRARVIEHFGIDEARASLMNDDRIGRALDRLYDLDPASLMTAVVTKAVREFKLDLRRIHNDTTTVTFSGAYEGQEDKSAAKRPPLITFGHNKDHRPDLKQLVYSLTICADGGVPVHYKTYDGNTTDDKTHIETWSTMREIRGRSDFIYVADSKLCTRENMAFIAGQGGRFVTVLPRSRKEDDDFRQIVRREPIAWEEILRKSNPRGSDRPAVVYWAFEPATRTVEGYRIIWYRSSVKVEHDEKRRTRRIDRARERIRELEARTGAHRFRSKDRAEQAVRQVLQDEGAERWLNVRVLEETVHDFKQATPGRPGRKTSYRRVEYPIVLIEVEDNAETIQADARCDGLFAMVTNVDNQSSRKILDIYKYQPFLEKRNEQLKSVLTVAPVFLKNPQRVAALLFVYFLAILLFALIERELRRRMKEEGIPHLPLYPENRPCVAPTTEVIFQAVEGVRQSRLADPDGNVLKVFHDEIPVHVKQMLRMLGVKLNAYGLGQ
jgi:transposase